MKFLWTAIFCHALSVAVGFSVNQLVGWQESQGHAYSSNGVLAHAALHSDHPGCAIIQPVSLLQKAMHPWTGNYEHKTHCQEIAVLKNTAEASRCSSLWWLMWVTVIFGIFFAGTIVVTCGPIGLNLFLIPVGVVWYYMVETGLLADYRSGAMSWTADGVNGALFSNVSLQCLEFVSFSYIMSLVIFFYVSIAIVFSLFGVCVSFIIPKMQAERHVTTPFLSEADKTFLASPEFQTKCVKAFREADADHNDVLDLNEMQHVLLFDLTDAEKQYVQESSLWKQAFEQCDADNSKTINSTEFVEVMKFVFTKAKFGVKKAEP